MRVIAMPENVALEMKDFLDSIYGIEPDDRIFVISKSYLHHEMDRGVKECGVKRIRVHDLRHSHVSLLIDMGFSAVAIGNRVGHESSEITYRYYGKKNLMTSCPSRCSDLLIHLPEQLYITNDSVH